MDTGYSPNSHQPFVHLQNPDCLRGRPASPFWWRAQDEPPEQCPLDPVLSGRETGTSVATSYTPGVDEDHSGFPRTRAGPWTKPTLQPLASGLVTPLREFLHCLTQFRLDFPFLAAPQRPDHYDSNQLLLPLELVKGYLCASPRQLPSCGFDSELDTGVGASPPHAAHDALGRGHHASPCLHLGVSKADPRTSCVSFICKVTPGSTRQEGGP